MQNIRAMLCTNIKDPNDPDPIDRQKLIWDAAYVASKHSIYDGIYDTPIFNMEHPVVFQSLLESMNNKEDILTQGQMLKSPNVAEFKRPKNWN